jgi:hypothetical protein
MDLLTREMPDGRKTEQEQFPLAFEALCGTLSEILENFTLQNYSVSIHCVPSGLQGRARVNA